MINWSKGGKSFESATKGATVRPRPRPRPCQTPTRTGPGLGPCHVTPGTLVLSSIQPPIPIHASVLVVGIAFAAQPSAWPTLGATRRDTPRGNCTSWPPGNRRHPCMQVEGYIKTYCASICTYVCVCVFVYTAYATHPTSYLHTQRREGGGKKKLADLPCDVELRREAATTRLLEAASACSTAAVRLAHSAHR